MNKDSIYRLIGYDGEYSNKVKKALRKLLKQYHPDHQGNEEIFKLINEVKRELETNQVTFKDYKKKTNNDFDDIDYQFCNKMIDNLDLQKKDIMNKIKKTKEMIEKTNLKYRNLYLDNLSQKALIIDKKSKFNERVMQRRIILLSLVFIAFLALFVLFNNFIFLILFIFGIIAIIFYLFQISKETNELFLNHKRHFNSYLKSSQEIERVLNTRKKLLHRENILKLELKKIENDLRFYHNLLKYK